MDDDQNMMDEEVDKSLHIKGQMNFMPDWNVVMFLGSPAIANLEQLQVVSSYCLICAFVVKASVNTTAIVNHVLW